MTTDASGHRRPSGQDPATPSRATARPIRATLASLTGTRASWRTHRDNAAHLERIGAGLEALARRAPAPQTGNGPAVAPVFLFSAGWRSGSTMLQRLINSDGRILVWGEAYDRCALLSRLAESLRPFSDAWPPASYLQQPASHADLTESWTANLYPPIEALRAAHLAFMDALYGAPARTLGFERWGFKDVRLGLEGALYLRWLYPDARFVVLQRDVYDAFRSYRSFNRAMNWYARWPDTPIFTPYAFARHWRRLSTELRSAGPRVGAAIVTYEDLVGGKVDLATLGEHCGVALEPGALAHRVGSGADRRSSGRGCELGALDRALIRLGAGHPPPRLETRIPAGPGA